MMKEVDGTLHSQLESGGPTTPKNPVQDCTILRNFQDF